MVSINSPQVEQVKWPVEYCESCGIFLTTTEAKRGEKTFDTSHRPTWHDHCPQCGHGYQVGFRELIIPKVMTEVKPIITLPSPDKETKIEPEDITESTGESQTFDKTKMVIERPKVDSAGSPQEPAKPTEVTPPTLSQNAPSQELACPECGKVCKNLAGLSAHQRIVHKKGVANAAIS